MSEQPLHVHGQGNLKLEENLNFSTIQLPAVFGEYGKCVTSSMSPVKPSSAGQCWSFSVPTDLRSTRGGRSEPQGLEYNPHVSLGG